MDQCEADTQVTITDLTLMTFTGTDGADQVIVPLLECSKEPYDYIIPTFSVLNVKLRRVKYEVNIPSKASSMVLNGLIKDNPSLDRLYPVQISIKSGVRHCCAAVI